MIYSKYQSNQEISKEEYKHYTIHQRSLQLYQGILSLISKKDKESLSALFGVNWKYLPLVTDCFYSNVFGIEMWVFFHFGRRAGDEARNRELL